tara:strand:+ start:67 stop:870 length:804 start_codon:yes stop_codon:yes gene_type:complete
MELILGDSLEILKNMEEKTVNTWITSPPYAKQRKYNGAESKDYLEFITPIIVEAKRTLKDEGNIFINIKEHCDKGQRDLYVFKMIIHFVEVVGLRFVDEFIWNKTNPFPTGSSSRLKDGYERVLHFTKSKKYQFYPNNVLIKSESKWLDSEKRRNNKGEHSVKNNSGMNMSKRVVSDMVRPSNVIKGTSSNLNIGHPAVFPNYLPEFFIKLTTNAGDVIGDMFMGSGTTGIVCKNLKRDFIGIELDKEYYKLAQKRIKEETSQLSLF